MNDLTDLFMEEETGAEHETEIATVDTVSSTGATLLFDGSAAAGSKKYKANNSVRIKTGDRVKVRKISGSYVIEYVIGNPMDRYPIPSGGSDGQVLQKDGSASYAVKWATPSSSGGLPTGGSSGQILRKTSDDNYACEWASVGTIPAGGTAGQYLKKTSGTDYACEWSAVATTKIGAGTYYIDVNDVTLGCALTPSSSGRVHLGTRQRNFGDLYAEGTISIGGSSYSSTLGFFGTTPIRQQSVANNATVATLITALKSYGLIS